MRDDDVIEEDGDFIGALEEEQACGEEGQVNVQFAEEVAKRAADHCASTVLRRKGRPGERRDFAAIHDDDPDRRRGPAHGFPASRCHT